MNTQPTQASPTQHDPPPDPNRICSLICTTGQHTQFAISAPVPKKGLVFGRSADADFSLHASSRLSNRHFRISYNPTDRSTWIVDTSTNGTHLNGVRLVKGSNYMLNQGDEIAVGVGVPSDVVRFVVLFADAYNPAKSTGESSRSDGIYADYVVKSEVIGQGAFATVKKCVERSSGRSYAVKMINRRKALNTGGALVGVDRELSILRKLDHPNIVALKAFYEDSDNYYIVMELVPGGDLMDFVAANGAIGEDATQVITRQVLEGISYVHKLGISHRDLKPDNVLIMQDDPILVKITDFGLAKFSDNSTFMKTFCGTLAYVAPEVITGKLESSNYSSSVDLWSLGCLVYVLLTSHLPFNGNTQAQMFAKIKKGEYHEAPLVSYDVSDLGRRFLAACLRVNPRERITAEEGLRHPWVRVEEVLSLSQSQSQQSRRIENGIAESMGRIEEDVMVRPLGGGNFKVPKRIVPQTTVPTNHKKSDSNLDGPGDERSQKGSHLPNQSLHLTGAVSPKHERDEKRLETIPSEYEGERRDENTDQSFAEAKRKRSEISESGETKRARLEGSRDKQNGTSGSDDSNILSDHLSETSSSIPIMLTPLPHSLVQAPIQILTTPHTIGRTPNCSTVIADDRMSKTHCIFTRRNGAVWLLDVSTNSCRVNATKVGKGRKVRLAEGDLVYLIVDQQTGQQIGYKVSFGGKSRDDVVRSEKQDRWDIDV